MDQKTFNVVCHTETCCFKSVDALDAAVVRKKTGVLF